MSYSVLFFKLWPELMLSEMSLRQQQTAHSRMQVVRVPDSVRPSGRLQEFFFVRLE